MVRSSFFSLCLSRTPGPRSPGLGFGGETGPLAASRESLSLSPPESSPSRGVPSGALLRTGESPSLGARGSLVGGCLAGPSYPLTGGRLWGRQSPVDSVKFGSPPPGGRRSVWVRFSDGSGSRTGQVLGRVRFSGRPLGGCLQQVVLGGRLGACRFGRLAGGDPRAVQSGPYRAIVPC